MKMNAEIRAEWTTRLRSGDYRQGQHNLRDIDDKFCCLGVLCEIAVEAGITKRALEDDQTRYSYGEGETAGLPDEVKAWAGIRSPLAYWQDGDAGYQGRTVGLAAMNDNHVPFSVIADVIDERF